MNLSLLALSCSHLPYIGNTIAYFSFACHNITTSLLIQMAPLTSMCSNLLSNIPLGSSTLLHVVYLHVAIANLTNSPVAFRQYSSSPFKGRMSLQPHETTFYGP